MSAAASRGGCGRCWCPAIWSRPIIGRGPRTSFPHLAVELIHSRAFLLSEPLASAGIEWATALTAAACPKGQAYPRVYQGLDGLLTAIEAAPSARGWAAALVRYELLVLGELGFGLDEDQSWRACPRTILDRLRLTGRHLARDLLTDRQAEVLAARERLVERLKRMARLTLAHRAAAVITEAAP